MLELSPESQQVIDEAVATGRFENPREAIDQAVRLLQAEMQENGQKGGNNLTAAEWCERFETWAESHRSLPRAADDSREGIYSGRDE